MTEATDHPLQEPPLDRFVAPGNSLATVAVTIAGLAGVLSVPADEREGWRTAATCALGVLHALLGTVGLYVLERRGNRRLVPVHFAVAFAVMIAAVALSLGRGSILCFSFVSQTVLYLDRRGVIAAIGASTASVLGIVALNAKTGADIAQAAIGWFAGVAFVVGFSYMTLRQHRARKEVERLAAELASANERLKAYARDIEELATVNERNRIARDIHDTVGHCLTVVHVQLQAAEASLARDPDKARDAIEKARQLAHEGLDEVRRSIKVLRGAAPAFRPITTAIQKLATECQTTGLPAAMQVSGAPRPLAEPVEYTLYRAAQEALTNVRRHANASTVKIELTFEKIDKVALRIEDDGVGSDGPNGGFGLVGVRERAEIVGGTVQVRTKVGGGFALEVEVPG